jgi:subtilase family serine protease
MSPRGVVAITAATILFAVGMSAPAESSSKVVLRPVCSQQAAVHCLSEVLTAADGSAIAGLTSTTSGWTAPQLESAYGVSDYIGTWGAGHSVAIVDAYDDPKAEADLGVYRAANHLPSCTMANGCLRKINQNGDPSPLPRPDAAWSEEISLDLDMVSALCPLCRITLVEANSDLSRTATVPDSADMYVAEQAAFATYADAVSNSWAAYEYQGETARDPQLVPPDRHTVVLFASGDRGLRVEYPAASPNVIAVGGTVLHHDAATQSWSQTAWSGSGSGCSAYEPQPTWQEGVVTGCSKRVTADVSAVAVGVAVYDSYGGQRGWAPENGTSASTPIVAALVALAGAHVNSPQDLYTAARTFGGFTNSGFDGPTGLGSPFGITALFGAPERVRLPRPC